jgi:hypothetical protein
MVQPTCIIWTVCSTTNWTAINPAKAKAKQGGDRLNHLFGFDQPATLSLPTAKQDLEVT